MDISTATAFVSVVNFLMDAIRNLQTINEQLENDNEALREELHMYYMADGILPPEE